MNATHPPPPHAHPFSYPPVPSSELSHRLAPSSCTPASFPLPPPIPSLGATLDSSPPLTDGVRRDTLPTPHSLPHSTLNPHSASFPPPSPPSLRRRKRCRFHGTKATERAQRSCVDAPPTTLPPPAWLSRAHHKRAVVRHVTYGDISWQEVVYPLGRSGNDGEEMVMCDFDGIEHESDADTGGREDVSGSATAKGTNEAGNARGGGRDDDGAGVRRTGSENEGSAKSDGDAPPPPSPGHPLGSDISPQDQPDPTPRTSQAASVGQSPPQKVASLSQCPSPSSSPLASAAATACRPDQTEPLTVDPSAIPSIAALLSSYEVADAFVARAGVSSPRYCATKSTPCSGWCERKGPRAKRELSPPAVSWATSPAIRARPSPRSRSPSSGG